jgi:ligand-binding sensor domain-containing protein
MLPYRRFTTKEDLPSNRVTAIFQDSKGFIWIGTDAGLTMYDGATFKTFTVVDGLPNPFVTDIIESRITPGTLWIASITKGISRYEHGSLKTWKFTSRYSEYCGYDRRTTVE